MGLTWFLRSYYKFILFFIVKSELYFDGSDNRSLTIYPKLYHKTDWSKTSYGIFLWQEKDINKWTDLVTAAWSIWHSTKTENETTFSKCEYIGPEDDLKILGGFCRKDKGLKSKTLKRNKPVLIFLWTASHMKIWIFGGAILSHTLETY